MAKKKTKKAEKVPGKKLNRILIEHKLEEALSDLKSFVGKKKFERRIKKAGKLLNDGFSRKALDNLRKVKENATPAGIDVPDDTTILIEELP
ncbi:MAG: hypothetical protein ABJA85_06990 [Bacteroidota bacterium]